MITIAPKSHRPVLYFWYQGGVGPLPKYVRLGCQNWVKLWNLHAAGIGHFCSGACCGHIFLEVWRAWLFWRSLDMTQSQHSDGLSELYGDQPHRLHLAKKFALRFCDSVIIFFLRKKELSWLLPIAFQVFASFWDGMHRRALRPPVARVKGFRCTARTSSWGN